MYRSDLIRAKKAAKGLTNDDICEGANVSGMTLSKVLKGETNIEYNSLTAVAAFLEIPLAELFGEKTVAEVI